MCFGHQRFKDTFNFKNIREQHIGFKTGKGRIEPGTSNYKIIISDQSYSFLKIQQFGPMISLTFSHKNQAIKGNLILFIGQPFS